jgi:hypothetical protein
MNYEYDFALSFAGEVRDVAKSIADLLIKNNARVFYDGYFESRMLGKKLTHYFHRKFGKDSKYVIILISKEYPMKDWTNLELSIAREEASNRKEEFILPIRLDNTKILGIHDDICYLDLREKSIEEAVELLLEKLEVDGLKDKGQNSTEILSEENYKDSARELLMKLNQSGMTLSEFLPLYYDFLLKIGEEKEIKWVEAELTGNIYETGKDNPEYFKYRNLRGYLSPVKIESFGFYSLDMIKSNKKYAMYPIDNYIPSISIFEFERYANDLDKIGIFTLNEQTVKNYNLETRNIKKLYFYFKSSDFNRIISNIKHKIARFLTKIIRK